MSTMTLPLSSPLQRNGGSRSGWQPVLLAPRRRRDRAPGVALSPSPVQAGPVARPTLVLTRRGRLVLRLGSLLLAAAAGIAAFALSQWPAQAGFGGSPAPTTHHLVMPGETLWSIAQQVQPTGDPRPLIEDIRQLNHLDRSSLLVGDDLLLPVHS